MNKLNLSENIVAVSAHNSLCAKIIEKFGFDAIWVSGFEMSAVYGLADNGTITLTEMANEVRQISENTSLPLIVDCDEGYGQISNVKRMGLEMVKAGASVICIEDNLFPKKHSFWAKGQKLSSKESHGDKIKLLKDYYPELKVIGRTEALIRGFGFEEALERAYYYEKCGADLILLHSRDVTGKEALEIPKKWKGKTPLVSIPTKFPFMTTKELFDLNYKVVIWANHTLRLSLKAINDGLVLLKQKDNAYAIEKYLGSLEDIYSLTDVKTMEEIEKKYGGNNE